MITKEVTEFIKKLERTNYKIEDALQDLAGFSRYLSREDLVFIKRRLKDIYHLK